MSGSESPERAPAETDTARVARRDSEQQLELALAAGRLGSWTFDIAARRFTSSTNSREIFGVGPDDPFDTVEAVVALVHPEDRALRQAAVDHAIATGEDLDVEYRVVRPDGAVVWILARGRATFEDGRAIRMAGVSLDITARKVADERQRLLLDELNHRVKNTLMSIQSIATQTMRDARDATLIESFIARIQAMAHAHDLLSEAAWVGASLGDVVTRTLAPCVVPGEEHRISADGPYVRLGPNAAVTLNMAFHELATNATKYGALSVPAGRLNVEWRADGAEAIIIDWREQGGPPVARPERRGFGSRLIEVGLPREMEGEAVLNFLPDGLWCRMRLPVSAKLSLHP